MCKINLCSFLILSSVLQHRVKVCLAFIVCVFMMAGYYIDGPHQQVRWKRGEEEEKETKVNETECCCDCVNMTADCGLH